MSQGHPLRNFCLREDKDGVRMEVALGRGVMSDSWWDLQALGVAGLGEYVGTDCKRREEFMATPAWSIEM